MPDGATLTYDTFSPCSQQQDHVDCTLMVCPGIGSSSESLYIQTFVNYAQGCGYRAVVLNHLGAIKNIRLTSPRIFNYGNTDDFNAMVEHVKKLYPDSKMIGVGFSMGGNLLLKYLGEKQSNRRNFFSAIICCTGFDILKSKHYFTSWEKLRRGYIWAMSLSHSLMLRHHRNSLFSGAENCSYDTKRLFRTTSMIDIDEQYSSRSAGFNTLDEYYNWASSINYIENIEGLPMILLNAQDDPIVPAELLSTAVDFAENRDDVIFAITKHGGHLGYFEGFSLRPRNITWLDRFVIEYANSAVHNLLVNQPPETNAVLPEVAETTLEKSENNLDEEEKNEDGNDQRLPNSRWYVEVET